MSITKKVVLGIAGTVLLGTFLFGTRFFGYVGSGVDSIREAADDAVPTAMKIKEAKRLVASSDKAIANLEKQMAITMAERDGLEESIKNTDERLAKLNEEMQYLAGVLRENDSEYVYVNTSNGKQKKSVSEVENKLKLTLANVRNAKKSLAIDKDSRDREEKKYEQYQQQYNSFIAKRDELNQWIKETESNQVALETRKATEAAQFDDSAFEEAEELLKEIKKDQAVQDNLIDIRQSHGTFEVQPNAEEEVDLLEEVKNELESNAKPSKMISTKKTDS